MKPVIVFALFIAGVSASTIRFQDTGLFRSEPLVIRRVEPEVRFVEPVVAKKTIPILRFTNDIRGVHLNDLKYETANGIAVSDNTQAVVGRGSMYEDESGRMVQAETGLVKTGQYSYTSPEGLPVTVTYTADENGFRAEGAHLPKPVELPADHIEIHREALARVGVVNSPLLVVRDAPVFRSVHQSPIVIRSDFF